MSPAATGYASSRSVSRPSVAPPVELELPPLRTVGFPDRSGVASALALFERPELHPHGPAGGTMPEGRGFSIQISPGVVGLRMSDPNRREKSKSFNPGPHEVPMVSHGSLCHDWADAHGLEEHTCSKCGAQRPGEPVPSRIVTAWSPRSRARFHRTIASLDWSPFFARSGTPVMVTLTYPGDWLTVAPTGKHAKAHLRAFCLRWKRRWGVAIAGMWKQEFQRRGAPHFHLFLMRPSTDPKSGHALSAAAFNDWLSRAWADIVKHPDPDQYAAHLRAGTGVDTQKGGDCRDPRRLAVYFGKHGAKTKDSKEYQHGVPREWLCDDDGVADPTKGSGRFWGYWGLEDATQSVYLELADYIVARRTVRRWYSARCRYLGRGKVRSLGAGGGMNGGWAMVNDGPAFASALSRAVALART